jgi:hypothetical protein
MNSNKWYKFLIKEEEQRLIKAPDLRNFPLSDFKQKFDELWKTNSYFSDSIIKIIMTKLLIPNLKKLGKENFLDIKKIVMEGQAENNSSSLYSLVNSIDRFGPLASVWHNTLVMFLNLFFFPKDPVYIKNIKEADTDSFVRAIYILFDMNPELIPTAPKLNKYKKGQDTRDENIDMIKHYYQIDPSDFNVPTILDEVKLVGYVGGGAYGKVFKTSDDRALKIFQDSVSLDKDLKRMSSVTEEVYQGTASLEDMHYFDKGKLGNSPYYYALMPLIVPIEKAPFFSTSPVFEEAVSSGYDTARYFRNYGATYDYQDFKDKVLENMKAYLTSPKGLQDMDTYKNTIDKIIRAAYRASVKFGGTDLHAGNIGYLAQKPDVFFYFDM